MARRTAQPAPQQPARLTPAQKRNAIPRLMKRHQELVEFDPHRVQGSSDPRVIALGQALDRALIDIFGCDTVDYERYKSVVSEFGKTYFGGDLPISTIRQYLEEDKARAMATFQGIIDSFKEDTEECAPVLTVAISNYKQIFVVHGHDEGMREAVARFIQALGFEPIILHERANEGRTIIEKVEAHGGVGFAVVLLTPDDEGCEKGGTPIPRARQNVVLELGYFIGRLGRNRVCALKRGELEIPSDFGGVVYEPFDASGGWKQKLGRELEAGGYKIDWNAVMRS